MLHLHPITHVFLCIALSTLKHFWPDTGFCSSVVQVLRKIGFKGESKINLLSKHFHLADTH